MIKLVMLLGSIFGVVGLCGQANSSPNPKILLVKGNAKFEKSDVFLTYDQLKSTLNQNQEAKIYLDKHKSGRSGAQGLAFIGGGLMGWPLGTAIGGGDPEWLLLGIGAGVTGIAFALDAKANDNLKKAVDIYNLGNGYSYEIEKPVIPTLVMTPTRFGLDLRF